MVVTPAPLPDWPAGRPQAQDVLDGRVPAPGDELPAGHVAELRRSLQVLDQLTGAFVGEAGAVGRGRTAPVTRDT